MLVRELMHAGLITWHTIDFKNRLRLADDMDLMGSTAPI